jgi:hypothetical protein
MHCPPWKSNLPVIPMDTWTLQIWFGQRIMRYASHNIEARKRHGSMVTFKLILNHALHNLFPFFGVASRLQDQG